MELTSKPKLRFLCLGSGAIGTYVGGSLLLSGRDVVFLDRPEPADEIRKSGLHLGLKGDEYHIPSPNIVGHIDEALTLGPYDAVIIAVKSFDTLALLDSLKAYSIALPPFICFQNGVENEAEITKVLGENKVIYGTITSAVGKRGPGSIILEKLRGIGISSDHILTATLVEALDTAGLNAKRFPSPLSMKWSKMLTNLMANATSAILDMTAEEIYSDPGLFCLEVEQLREALRVMEALKISVTDLPGTPIKAIALGVKYFPSFLLRPLMKQGIGKGRGEKMPSFHIDLYGGRGKSEVEYLNGAVVRFGEAVNVSAPINRLLTDTLTALTTGKMEKSEFAHQPEKLLALIK